MNQNLIAIVFEYSCSTVDKRIIRRNMQKIRKKTKHLNPNIVGHDNVYVCEFDNIKSAQKFADTLSKFHDEGVVAGACGFEQIHNNENDSLDEIVEILHSLHDSRIENFILDDVLDYMEDFEDKFRGKKPTREEYEYEMKKFGLPFRYLDLFIELCDNNLCYEEYSDEEGEI